MGDVFILDLEWASKDYFFIPIRPLLGDLCLWAGRYTEAARWYNSFLNDSKEPVEMLSNATVWNTVSEFKYPSNSYASIFSLSNNNRESLSLIPMESIVFNGTVSELRNLFCSTSENKYYFQLTPSPSMFQLSSDQIYCIENKATNPSDTIYVPKTGLLDDVLRGDLRLYSIYSQNSLGSQDPYSETSSLRQSITKTSTNAISTYRRTMVYLRYAEALNRAGLPQSAMTILKYGICADNVKLYVDSLEQEKAGSLISFDPNVFTGAQAIGVHSRGCGDSFANAYYVLPQPGTALATRQDTIDFQIPLVEDLIINEMALEGAFEGNRFYDLMRVALRRGDAAYLADAISRREVSRREGKVDAALRAKLMDKNNWYLPLP